MPSATRSRHSHGRSEIWERSGLVRAFERERRRLGLRLREIRSERGLTLEDAAERIGIHSKHLQRIELAKENVSFATLVAVSVGYGVPLRELFDAA